MEEKFKIITAVMILFRKDNNILLSRRFNTGHEDGNYSVVAGHVEVNESVLSAAIREAKEEVGVNVLKEHLRLVTTMHHGKTNYVDFYFEVTKWSGEITNTEPDKCDDLRWFPIDELPENTIPYIRQAIECYQKGELYSEWGGEVNVV